MQGNLRAIFNKVELNGEGRTGVSTDWLTGSITERNYHGNRYGQKVLGEGHSV